MAMACSFSATNRSSPAAPALILALAIPPGVYIVRVGKDDLRGLIVVGDPARLAVGNEPLTLVHIPQVDPVLPLHRNEIARSGISIRLSDRHHQRGQESCEKPSPGHGNDAGAIPWRRSTSVPHSFNHPCQGGPGTARAAQFLRVSRASSCGSPGCSRS